MSELPVQRLFAELLALDVDAAARVLVGAFARAIAADPALAASFTSTRPDASAALLLSRKAYAARVSLAVRTLDKTLPLGCYAGRGRLRRVIVEKADAFLLASNERAKPVDDVAELARKNARRPAKKRSA